MISDANRAKREVLKDKYNRTRKRSDYDILMEFDAYLASINESG